MAKPSWVTRTVLGIFFIREITIFLLKYRVIINLIYSLIQSITPCHICRFIYEFQLGARTVQLEERWTEGLKVPVSIPGLSRYFQIILKRVNSIFTGNIFFLIWEFFFQKIFFSSLNLFQLVCRALIFFIVKETFTWSQVSNFRQPQWCKS